MKIKTIITILIVSMLIVLWVFPFPVYGNSLPHTVHPIPKVGSSIHVDGVMDEEAWNRALKLELKYEIEPGENIQPPVRTEVFIIYSKTHFYVGFRAYDPDPSAIRANFTDRDTIFNDDYVGIVLDTFNDQRRYYSFYCNPYGIQAEFIESNKQKDYQWDAIWASAGRVNAGGYMVEIAIPFSSLRFQYKKEGQEQVWGFDAIRNYPRNLNHFIGFIPRDRNNFCYTCQIAKIMGFKSAHPGKNLELNPSFSTLVTQEREDSPGGGWAKGQSQLDPGLSAHWGITPNITMNAAINPDFSHVEADAAQLDINTDFALYYPEKRPFFLEGVSIFKTRFAAVYTRSLADPDWGIKLTGKEKAHALGLYSVRDNITNLLFPASRGSRSTSLDMKTIGSVLRYRLDMGKLSTLGVLFTDRESGDYFNRLAGIDTFIRLTGRKHLDMQFLVSQTRYPRQVAADYGQPGSKFNGTALDIFFQHESRNFGYFATYQQVSPGFRADLGFMPQVGYRHISASAVFASWRNPGHWYTFIYLLPSFEYETDYDGHLISKFFKLAWRYNGPAQSYLKLEGILGEQSFMGNILNTNHIRLYSGIQPSGQLSLWFNGAFGHQIDFANAQEGTRIMFNPGIIYKINRHISLDLDHTLERLNVDAGRLYTANITYLKMVYHFNRRTFFRAILQYVDYNYNPDLYSFEIDPGYRHLFTQFLFSYKLNPRTVLFLGYSDNYYGYHHIELTQTNRTGFIKVSYALR